MEDGGLVLTACHIGSRGCAADRLLDDCWHGPSGACLRPQLRAGECVWNANAETDQPKCGPKPCEGAAYLPMLQCTYAAFENPQAAECPAGAHMRPKTLLHSSRCAGV